MLMPVLPVDSFVETLLLLLPGSVSGKCYNMEAPAVLFYAAFTPDTCSPDISCIHCIPCRRLHVSCIGYKIVVTATCIYLYPLVSRYKLLVRDSCRRLHVSVVNAAL